MRGLASRLTSRLRSLGAVRTPAQPPLNGPRPPGTAPAPLIVAGSVVGLEAFALVVFGIVEIATTSSARVTMGVTTAFFFLAYGLGLGACGWLLTRLRSWTRAPVVLAQLIQLGVAWSFKGGAGSAASAGLLVLAVIVLAGVFHPASIDALAEADHADRA